MRVSDTIAAINWHALVVVRLIGVWIAHFAIEAAVSYFFEVINLLRRTLEVGLDLKVIQIADVLYVLEVESINVT